MNRREDLTGKKFGSLTVLGDTEKRNHRHIIYLCQCDCGNTVEIQSNRLRSGKKNDCGCLKSKVKHDDCRRARNGGRSWLYRVWGNMKQRCYNSRNSCYRWYGARGIKVCEAWRDSYAAFKEWALSHGYREGLSIDRIDNDGDYEPDNVQFISKSENRRKQQEDLKKYVAKYALEHGLLSD